MPRQSKPAAKDPSVVPLPWLDPDWMEKADIFGSRYFDQFSKAGFEALDKAEVLVEDHLVFVRERVHADFECAKALSKTADPFEATRVMSEFWQKLVSDYSAAADNYTKKARDIAETAYASGSEIAETTRAAAETAEKAVEKATKTSAA